MPKKNKKLQEQEKKALSRKEEKENIEEKEKTQDEKKDNLQREREEQSLHQQRIKVLEKEELHYKKPKKTKKERKHEVLFLSPSLLGVLVFFIVPFFVIIYYSLVDNPVNHEFVFLENFKNLFHNSAFIQAAKNTATFSLVAVPLAVVLSLVMAMILEQNIPMKSQFRTFFLSPMMVPVASIVLIWQVLFDYHGAINEFIGHLGMAPIDWFKSSYSQIVIVILFLWKNLGYNMILFMAALNAIPKDVLEVATLDSASEFQKFWYIKIRYLSSTILFVAILSLINSFKVFREVYLLTGNYPYDTLYMLQHFMNNTFQSLDYQKLSAAAIIMALVMAAVIALLFIAEDKFGKDVEG